MSKEAFKSFARNHKELANYVITGKTSWQKLYEIYDIYGENSTIWDDYFSNTYEAAQTAATASLAATEETSPTNIKDLFTSIKNVDLTSVQKGITNIQKTIGLLQDIGLGDKKMPTTSTYEPRPMYKYFED